MTQIVRKPFTGYHMTAILVGFFGIVIAVNLYMAKAAIGTFGGTVVDNSYVASQQYNDWLAQADREARLGWTLNVAKAGDGRVAIAVSDNGAPGNDFTVTAKAENPLGRAPERRLHFRAAGGGNYISLAPVPHGRWLLRIEVMRGGERYRMIANVQ